MALLVVLTNDYYIFWKSKSRTIFKATLLIWLLFVPYLSLFTGLFLLRRLHQFKDFASMQCLLDYTKFIIDMEIEAGSVIVYHCAQVVLLIGVRIVLMFTVLDLIVWQRIKFWLGCPRNAH